MEFITGHWYRFNGTSRPRGWHSGGWMDFMLDGKPHLCTDGQRGSASFADQDHEEDHRWHWDTSNGLNDFEEVSVKTVNGKSYYIVNPTIENFFVDKYYVFTGGNMGLPNWCSDMDIVRSGEPLLCTWSDSFQRAAFGAHTTSFFYGHVLEYFQEVMPLCTTTPALCSHCGNPMQRPRSIHVGDVIEQWCPFCAISHSATCMHCGERYAHSDLSTPNIYSYLCPTHAPLYTTCEECGEAVEISHTHMYQGRRCCSDCGRIIHSHDYKPTPNFMGTGKRFYGMELEVDNMPDSSIADWMLSHSEMESLYYLKHDGSLCYGFEIVTHPMTFDVFAEKKSLFTTICDYLTSQKMKSHDTTTCGLHFHVSRAGFGDTSTEQRRVAVRVVYLYEKFFSVFLKLSRRTIEELDEWASRYFEGGEKMTTTEIPRKWRFADRYKAINMTNEKTIEFRFFKGTLNVNTIFASMQLLDNLINIAQTTKRIDSITMEDIIKQTSYDELTAYATQKGILGGK